jgi:hypothetical protein
MPEDTPRQYGREYNRDLPGPLRIRVGRDTNKGEVTRFLVQLEYFYDSDWHVVVRYDHDREGSEEASYDVTEDGLHIDIYRNDEKHASEFVVGPMPATPALDHAEDHLAQNLERFVQRYERWHGIQRDR